MLRGDHAQADISELIFLSHRILISVIDQLYKGSLGLRADYAAQSDDWRYLLVEAVNDRRCRIIDHLIGLDDQRLFYNIGFWLCRVLFLPEF